MPLADPEADTRDRLVGVATRRSTQQTHSRSESTQRAQSLLLGHGGQTALSTKRTIQISAVAVAAVHFIGVLLTWWYISVTPDGDAPFAWVFWTIIDLPWSMAIAEYMNEFHPWFVHGVIGSAWWYLLSLGIGKAIN